MKKRFYTYIDIVREPGLFFSTSTNKRNIYKKLMHFIVSFFENGKKKVWLKAIQSKSSLSIDTTAGYASFPPGIISPHLSNKVIEVCKKIKEENRDPFIVEPTRKKRFLMRITNEQDIIDNPVLLEYALSSDVLSIVSKYLGCSPLLSSISLLKSAKTNESLQLSQLFHCDAEDLKQVRVFLHINDVSPKNGPLCLVPADISRKFIDKTGYTKWGEGSGHLSDSKADYLIDNVKVLSGPQGQVSFFDTSNVFHYGSRVDEGERYILSIQFLTMSSFIFNPLFSLFSKTTNIEYPYIKIAKQAKITTNLYALGIRKL